MLAPTLQVLFLENTNPQGLSCSQEFCMCPVLIPCPGMPTCFTPLRFQGWSQPKKTDCSANLIYCAVVQTPYIPLWRFEAALCPGPIKDGLPTVPELEESPEGQADAEAKPGKQAAEEAPEPKPESKVTSQPVLQAPMMLDDQMAKLVVSMNLLCKTVQM